MDTNKSIQLAFQHYQTGDFQQAKHICTEILKEQPNNEEILYLIGIVHAQLDESDAAIHYLERSLQFNMFNADAHLALGAICQKKGLLDEAVNFFGKAVEIDPNFAEAYENLGDIFRDKDQLDKAITYYKKALRYFPNSAEIHCNLGSIFKKKKIFDIATTYYRTALKYDPNYADAYNNLGFVYKEQRRLDEAITFYQKALQLNPNYAEAYANLGFAFHEKGHLDEAINCFQRALQINPKSIGVYAYIIMGIIFQRKGQINNAINCYQKALELDGDNALAHFNMAFAFFSSGDLNRGWKEFEWRWKLETGINVSRSFSQPLWKGEDISRCTILLHDEPIGVAGFGDTIQFIRYASLLAKRAANVLFECKKELISLLTNVEGVDQIIELGKQTPAFDVHCFLLDLPFLFDISLANIPSRIPYISVDPTLVQKWAEKIGPKKDKFRIGLVWAAGAGQGERSCTLETFSSLGFSDSIIFYSLQKGEAAEQARNVPEGMRLINLSAEFYDFSDTAALIEGLDLVISVDTAVAHLAGALGKPIWTLLPYVSPWRWMLNRVDSPWYPTMRLFRQPSPGDWQSVIEKVKNELLKLLDGN
jgi:tetratricopeptide (TPR) repeat protein